MLARVLPLECCISTGNADRASRRQQNRLGARVLKRNKAAVGAPLATFIQSSLAGFSRIGSTGSAGTDEEASLSGQGKLVRRGPVAPCCRRMRVAVQGFGS